IGFPTANLEPECMVPADGVYAGLGALPDGRVLPAAISIGSKPTFEAGVRAVEAFLMSETGDGAGGTEGLPEYGRTDGLPLIAWVRDQVRFESAGELVEQMKRDCRRTQALVASEALTCR